MLRFLSGYTKLVFELDCFEVMIMYTEIGAFDAKAKLSQLLQEVKRGQRFTITVRGQPIADLIPSENIAEQDINAAIEAMNSIKKVEGVTAANITEWIKEGRK